VPDNDVGDLLLQVGAFGFCSSWCDGVLHFSFLSAYGVDGCTDKKPEFKRTYRLEFWSGVELFFFEKRGKF
jgi:hypothetical protein